MVTLFHCKLKQYYKSLLFRKVDLKTFDFQEDNKFELMSYLSEQTDKEWFYESFKLGL